MMADPQQITLTDPGQWLQRKGSAAPVAPADPGEWLKRAPVAAGTAPAAQESPGNHFGDIIGDAIANGPKRFMDFMTGHPYEDLKQHAFEMGQKAREAFKAGDTSTGIGYLTAAFLPGVGDEAIKSGEEFGSGNPSGGIGHAVLALAPFLGPPALEAAAPYAGAAAEGIKAAAPDLAAGTAKIAGGEVLAKVPGLEWPSRLSLQYPGLKQIRNAVPKGVEAFKAALDAAKPVGPPSIAPVAEAASEAPPAPAPVPEAAPTPAPPPVAPSPVANPATLDEIAVSLTGKKFNQLKGMDQANVINTHAAIVRNGTASATTPVVPPSTPVVPNGAPVSPAEALRDMLAPNAPKNSAGVATIAPVAQEPLDAGMLSLPAQTRKAAADANYRAQATNGEGVPGGQAYEAAARANKVDPLVESLAAKLKEAGISAQDAGTLKDPQFKPHWAALAHDLGIKQPSATTIDRVIQELQKREAAK